MFSVNKNPRNLTKMISGPRRRLYISILLAIFTGSLVSGTGERCSAYVFPGSDDVDLKFASILSMHDSLEGRCSDSYQPGDFQQAVALNWAVNLLNGDNDTESFIPGVRFGVDVYDDCSNAYLAAEHAGILASEIEGITHCHYGQDSTTPSPPIAGIIGTSISSTTTMVATIIKPTNVPVVGISATLPELGDKTKYPGFMRTVPSDLKQAQVIIELAKTFQWSYIVGIHTVDSYGTQGMAELKRMAKEERICICFVKELDVYSALDENMLENLIRRTLESKVEKSKEGIGVVYFGRDSQLHTLLKFMKSKRSVWLNSYYLRRIHWIATDWVVASKSLSAYFNEFGSKILLVGPPHAELNSFADYYQQVVENPPDWVKGQWKVALKDVATKVFKCHNYNFTQESMKGCDYTAIRNILSYMTATLDAVYIQANTLKKVHQQVCNGPGVCDSFREIIVDGLLTYTDVQDLNYTSIDPVYIPKEFSEDQRYLRNNSGDFQAINQILYSVEGSVDGDFKQIGEFSNQTVMVYPKYQNIVPTAQCKGVCEECHNVDGIDYLFSSGSVLILGLFSIHWQSTKNDFECGVYRNESFSFIAVKAFLNSIDRLRKRTGADFGYLVIDDCYNSLTATRMLVRILSGDLQIIDKTTGIAFDSSRVVAAIGAQSSPVTIAVLPILGKLNIPMISYSSTNPDLDNRITYPYFSRTVSSDTVQADAMVKILKEFGVTYVGATAIQNSYGMALYNQFRTKAEAEGICVDDAFQMTAETTADEVKPVLMSYRTRNIQVVVSFTMDTISSTILDAVQQEDTFVFIASEAWGPNANIIEGVRGERARGSLVLGASTAMQLDYGLWEYLNKIEPYTTEGTGWLREFWQDQFKCYLPGGFNNIFQNVCPVRPKGQYFSESELDELVNSPLAVHTTMATMAAGQAAASLLSKTSSQSLPFDPVQMTKVIRQITLASATGQVFRPFLDNGNGNGGFQIYNVQQKGGTYVYENVGDIKSNGVVDIDRSLVKFYDAIGGVLDYVDSSCLHKRDCKVCAEDPIINPTTNGTGTTPPVSRQVSDDSDTTLKIVLGIVCGLFALILIVVAILVCRGKVSWRRNENRYTDSSSVSMPRYYSKARGFGAAPPLPGRPETQASHSNRASSAIADADNRILPEEDIQTRPRSVSLATDQPTQYHGDPNTLALPLPKPHSIASSERSSRNTVSSRGSRHSEPAIHNLRANPSQEVSPAKFFLPSSEGQHQRSLSPGNPVNSGQVLSPEEDNFSDIYNQRYRNFADVSPTPPPPYQPIIFHNVSDGNNLYSINSQVPSTNVPLNSPYHTYPEYIYIQTGEGLMPILFSDWVALQNPGISQKRNLQYQIRPESNQQPRSNAGAYIPQNQPTVIQHSELNNAPPPPRHHIPNTDLGTYITPIDNPNNYAPNQSTSNLVNAQIHTGNRCQSSPSVSSQPVFSTLAPSQVQSPSVAPKITNANEPSSYTVNSADYSAPAQNLQVVPYAIPEIIQHLHAQNTTVNGYTGQHPLPQHTSMALNGTSDVSPQNERRLPSFKTTSATRPNVLPVTPVVLQNGQSDSQDHLPKSQSQTQEKTLNNCTTPTSIPTPSPPNQGKNASFQTTQNGLSPEINGQPDTVIKTRPRDHRSPTISSRPRHSDILEIDDVAEIEMDV